MSETDAAEDNYPTAEEIEENFKVDPDSVTHPISLAVLRELTPFQLAGLFKRLGITGDQKRALQDLIKQKESASDKTDDDELELSDLSDEIIKGKARIIAERGDAFKYLIWQAQRNHLGDISYQKVLVASTASTASATSQGIQPGGTGDKGSGKSDACAAVYHLVPMDRRLDGSLSPMSLFYLQEKGRLKPGMVLFSDDVEYEPILPIYKRSTARFQQGITHYTVSSGKNREAMELHIPPRLSWWLTSVESVANEQANDRQSPISTDPSLAHKKMVSKEIGARRARKELRLTEDDGILVAREILSDIYDNGPFKVLIPQADKAEWLKYADFRGQEQFWDLVDALAILRWRQRTIDSDGWLVAADEDLIEAKDILTAHKVANLSDLTPAEVQLVGVMAGLFGMSQKELTENLGIAQSTLSERLKSIMAKSPIITEDIVSGKKVYTLNPNMDLGQAYWDGLELVDVKIASEEAYRKRQIALSSCYRYLIGLPIVIIISNSNRIPDTLSVKKESVGENEVTLEDSCISCEKCLGIFSSLSSTENTDKSQKEPTDCDLGTDKVTDKDRKPPITLSGEGDNLIDYDGPACPDSDLHGPNMGKVERPTPIRLATIRILDHVDLFVGIDELNHGPFEADDVVSMPRIHAKNLVEISKKAEYVVEVRT